MSAYRTQAERERVVSRPRAVVTADGHRTRAITPTDDEIARGGERTIEVRRMVHCKACDGGGCAECEEQGFRLRKTRCTIGVPAGAADGSVLTLEGEGDVRERGNGNVLVHVTFESAIDDRIEKDDRGLARRQKAWLRERGKTNRQAKRRRKLAIGAAAGVMALLGALALGKYLGKNVVGESCERPSDCRTDLCVESTGIRIGGGQTGMVSTKKCSQRCAAEADCPSGMACKDGVDVIDPMTALPSSQARLCVPR